MNKNNKKPKKIAVSLIIGFVFVLTGCNEIKQSNAENPRGTPSIVIDTLIYEATSEAFSLILHADSTAGAKVNYCLYDGDSLIQENTDGVFHNIEPLIEGYFVRADVAWNDTTMHTPMTHIGGCIVPCKPVDKISKTDLQSLINAQDSGLSQGKNEHLAQGVSFKTQDGQKFSMQDVMLNLSNKVWGIVEVKEIYFNDNNQVSDVIIKPEVLIKPDPDDEEWF